MAEVPSAEEASRDLANAEGVSKSFDVRCHRGQGASDTPSRRKLIVCGRISTVWLLACACTGRPVFMGAVAVNQRCGGSVMRKFLVPAMVLALAVGCTGSDPEPTETVASTPVATATTASATPSRTLSPQPSQTPSPSPTVHESFPAPPSTETPEQAAIRAAVIEYWRVYEKFTTDSSLTDYSETQRVTTGDRKVRIIEAITRLRDQSQETRGSRTFRNLVIAAPTTGQSGTQQTVVTYCVDPSGISVVDSDTEEVIHEGGDVTLLEQMTLEQGADGIWRVLDIANQMVDC